jgi:hypothetical protein
MLTRYSDRLLLSGWRRCVGAYLGRGGRRVPYVKITVLRADATHTIRVFDPEPVLRAIELARAETAEMFSQQVGWLSWGHGNRVAVFARRHRGHSGVSFHVVDRDGRLLGKPKSLIGCEGEALRRACEDLQSELRKRVSTQSRLGENTP